VINAQAMQLTLVVCARAAANGCIAGGSADCAADHSGSSRRRSRWWVVDRGVGVRRAAVKP
jgi:hypothetical protein